MFIEFVYLMTLLLSEVSAIEGQYDRAIFTAFIGFNILWFGNVYPKFKKSKENNDGKY